MPRQRRRTPPRKQALLGFYDLSTRLLPGGTELQALAAGFSLMQGYERGYSSAAAESNQLLLKDTKNAYLVADLNDPRGRLARAVTQPDLFKEYAAELTIRMPTTNEKKLHHDIGRAMGIPRGQKVADGLPFLHTLSLRNDTLFVTHVAAAQTAIARAQARALKAP